MELQEQIDSGKIQNEKIDLLFFQEMYFSYIYHISILLLI